MEFVKNRNINVKIPATDPNQGPPNSLSRVEMADR